MGYRSNDLLLTSRAGEGTSIPLLEDENEDICEEQDVGTDEGEADVDGFESDPDAI